MQVHVARFLAVAIGGGAVVVATAVVHSTLITWFSPNLPTVQFLRKELPTRQVRDHRMSSAVHFMIMNGF